MASNWWEGNGGQHEPEPIDDPEEEKGILKSLASIFFNKRHHDDMADQGESGLFGDPHGGPLNNRMQVQILPGVL
jgi:hypothetical protein